LTKRSPDEVINDVMDEIAIGESTPNFNSFVSERQAWQVLDRFTFMKDDIEELNRCYRLKSRPRWKNIYVDPKDPCWETTVRILFMQRESFTLLQNYSMNQRSLCRMANLQ
jgi:hypothetical protein